MFLFELWYIRLVLMFGFFSIKLLVVFFRNILLIRVLVLKVYWFDYFSLLYNEVFKCLVVIFISI